MISVEKFSFFLYEQLLKPLCMHDWGFKPSHSTELKDFTMLNDIDNFSGRTAGRCIWWHEEPINYSNLDNIQHHLPTDDRLRPYGSAEFVVVPGEPKLIPLCLHMHDTNFHIFANSEISQKKRKYLKEWNVHDWYFFFHGFAALDWFRDFKYLSYSERQYQPSKVFICLNHLITNNRSYRLYLLSQLKQKDLFKFGHISSPLLTKETIKKELADFNCRLPITAKKHILNNLLPIADPIKLDSINYNNASASIDMHYSGQSLWHIVPETMYYDESLHLTEKIFKPIAIKRPFILVGAPGNLAYLKSYGFKTFDRWIDESYDKETDPERRIQMIADQIEKICEQDVKTMHAEMQDVLEYNHQHLYGKFKEIIVDELLWNFKKQVNWYNLGCSERHRLPIDRINFEQVRRLMLS